VSFSAGDEQLCLRGQQRSNTRFSCWSEGHTAHFLLFGDREPMHAKGKSTIC
jgi:hypothetical protein